MVQRSKVGVHLVQSGNWVSGVWGSLAVGSSLIAGFSGLCDGMGSDALGQGVNPGGAGG